MITLRLFDKNRKHLADWVIWPPVEAPPQSPRFSPVPSQMEDRVALATPYPHIVIWDGTNRHFTVDPATLPGRPHVDGETVYDFACYYECDGPVTIGRL